MGKKNKLRKAKKQVVANNKKSLTGSNRQYISGSTSTELQNLLRGGRIEINPNTYYNLYVGNTDLRAGIRKIASKVAVNGFHLVDDDGETLEKPDLLKALKTIFTDPERGLRTFTAWKQEAFKHYLIGGELYLLPIINGIGQLVHFQILDPRTITKFYNNEGVITKFQQFSGTKTRTFEADKIGFYKLEDDPNNPINGLSLLQSVVWDALTDDEAMSRNYSFFKNDKLPRAILKLRPECDFGSDEVQDQIDIMDNSINGSDKAHKSIISNLIDGVEVLEVSNKDMEFIQQRKLTTDKVCALLGIPKSQLGYQEGINYASSQQFYIDFISETILPRQSDFEEVLNDALDRFTTGFEEIDIVLDTEDAVDTYKYHKDQREDVKAGILTRNEVREERGKPPLEENKNTNNNTSDTTETEEETDEAS